MVPCIDNGTELRSEFVVIVRHEGKPLPGATIQIARADAENADKLFSGTTAADGTVRVERLPSGSYLLSAQLLGIFANSECFHVGKTSSKGAKKEISFKWGNEPPEAREATGKLVHSQAAYDRSPQWNAHRVYIPIPKAMLSLRAVQSAAFYHARSDKDGHFTFGEIPEGIYVLRVEGAGIEPTNLLFRVSHTAEKKTLFVDDADPIGGGCGGWYLEPDYTQN